MQRNESNQQKSGRQKPGDEVRMPVVEEEVHVGKREVETGGVRVEQKVTEKPVREQVELHEEKVDVERRPTNRPATAADLGTQPGEQAFEVRETREEPVVQKSARVVEEVVVHKEDRDRVETVEDTVRRKDVEVHDIGAHRGDSEYGKYENDFRTYHTSTYGSSGATYDQWAPAYRYGYTLAGDERYRGKDWNAFEPEVRRDWEARNPGTWDRMKGAVRHGWDRVKQGSHSATR